MNAWRPASVIQYCNPFDMRALIQPFLTILPSVGSRVGRSAGPVFQLPDSKACNALRSWYCGRVLIRGGILSIYFLRPSARAALAAAVRLRKPRRIETSLTVLHAAVRTKELRHRNAGYQPNPLFDGHHFALAFARSTRTSRNNEGPSVRRRFRVAFSSGDTSSISSSICLAASAAARAC